MDELYRAGQSYEVEMLANARRSARAYMWIAVVAIVVALMFGVGYAFIASQHTVTSHVIKVDKASGSTEVLSITSMRDVPMQSIEAMASVRRYVVSRERYYYGIVQLDYNDVIAMSDDSIVNEANTEIKSKVERYKDGTDEKVDILNVTLPPDQIGRAVVRFQKTTRQAGRTENVQTRNYIATIAYRFVALPTGRREILLLNPLGFKVNAYVVEPELAAR